MGRLDDAEALFAANVEAWRRVAGEDRAETLTALSNLCGIHWRQQRYEEAEAECLEALNGQRRLIGEDHPSTLHTMQNLAQTYLGQRRYEEAMDGFGEALKIRSRVLGPDHPHTIESMAGLAMHTRVIQPLSIRKGGTRNAVINELAIRLQGKTIQATSSLAAMPIPGMSQVAM